MEALSGMYEKPLANNKVHLMKKLFNLKMTKDTSITQHLNNFNTITNQLSSIKIEFDDEIRALILLASLPNSWEGMRTAVQLSTLTLEGGDMIEAYSKADQNQDTKVKASLDPESRLNVGIIMRSCTKPKKPEADSTNATTDEAQDTLIHAVQSPIDDWILDSSYSFYCTPHHEMMQNYVAEIKV
uniref:Retrovirus-related Pol polyprotein from transposon TNT 1-94 n=1 Tax=Populus alba TaxID=43335 RepID=A0A4U5QN55_POPAL|nr:hypothetical protein D5086_0000069970 [Populus alba]